MKVIDGIMGCGKTEWAMDYMFTSTNLSFIFVTPFLSEIERVKQKGGEICVDVKEPDNRGCGKLDNLKRMLTYKPRIIATTHSLFNLFDDDVMDMLKDYVLIIDEVPDVVQLLPVTKDEVDMLAASGAIDVSEGKVYWTGKYNNFSIPALTDIKDEISKGGVYVTPQGLVEELNGEVLQSFRDVWVLTYLFDYSILKWWFDKKGIEYVKFGLKDGEIINYTYTGGEKYKDLIDVYEGKLNTNYSPTPYALSKSWFNKSENHKSVDQLKRNMYNYFRQIAPSPADERLWTCFEGDRAKLTGKGYGSAFIPCNSRASNNYRHTTVLVYAINRYLNPILKQYFQAADIAVNEDGYALAQMLQWIWRSKIRDGGKIKLYIPSERMRTLLKNWLDGKIVT